MENLLQKVESYIKLNMNRLRCSKCNSEYGKDIIVDPSGVRIGSSLEPPKFRRPLRKKASNVRGTLYVNRSRTAEMANVLYLVCPKCGHFRGVLMPKSASNHVKDA